MSDETADKYPCPEGLRADWWAMLIDELGYRSRSFEKQGGPHDFASIHASPSEAAHILKCLERRAEPVDLGKVVAIVRTPIDQSTYHLFASWEDAKRFVAAQPQACWAIGDCSVAYHPPESETWPIERVAERKGMTWTVRVFKDGRYNLPMEIHAEDWPVIEAAVNDALAEYRRRKGVSN